MPTRMQIQHRIRIDRLAERVETERRAHELLSLADAVSSGTGGPVPAERPAPVAVPEILQTTGGHAVIVHDRVTTSAGYADVWGEAR